MLRSWIVTFVLSLEAWYLLNVASLSQILSVLIFVPDRGIESLKAVPVDFTICSL